MYDTAYDLLPIPMTELHPVYNEQGEVVDFSYAWVNSYITKKTGKPAEFFDKQTLMSVHGLEDGERLRDIFKTVMETGVSAKTLFGSRQSELFEGDVYQLMGSKTENGCLSLIQDITALVEENDKTAARLHLLEAACHDSVHGMAIADEDHKLVYVNPALCEKLEYTDAELLELHISDITDRDEQEVRQSMSDSLQSSEIEQYISDRTYITKSGEPITMEVAVSTTEASDGTYRALAHFRDVREERAAQEALQQALMAAEESTRMKSEFLANMSHEIRTPLNGVIGMAQVLGFSELNKEQAEHVSIIKESGQNLMTLLNDILDLSKVEAGKIDIAPINVDVRHKLNRVFNLQKASATGKGIGLDFVVHPSVPSEVMVDPVRIHQCVGNLISNAIKFTEDGKVIVAVTSNPISDGHELVIHVSDTGIGIPADKLEAIFESFQQADGSTTRHYGGTGLGLSITRKLARLMGGDLTVVSEEGRGSVFTLRIRTGAVDTAKHTLDTVDETTERQGFAQHKILVVDDNLVNRQVARSLLEAYGFSVVQAADGQDALNKLDEDAFDLVLMDIHMPGMDGIKAFKALRASSTTNKDIPVIALTADAMNGDRERYMSEGMTGYVSKPVNERDMISEIGRVLSLGDFEGLKGQIAS